MPGIIVGSVAVEVVPDATGFDERMRSALSDQKVDVKVNVDTGEAVAKMAALRAEMDAATKDTGGSGGGFFSGLAASAADANSSISNMTAAVLILGPTLVPLAAVGAGIAAAFGAAFATIAAGAGVAELAFSGIGAAVKAIDQQAVSSGATWSQAALQRIADAQSIRAAAQQVTSAQQGLAQSEQNLTNAVYNEQQAQLGLVDARKAAQRQLESYSQQLADGALQQRQNQLAVEQAQQTLQQTLANPLSTDLQRQQAQLAYDQAVQQQKDQSENYKNLQEDAAAAAKAGVDGNQQVEAAARKVVTAQQAVAQAHQQVQNSTTSLATAQANVAATNERIALSADKASAGSNALAKAMSKLSPAGQEFAEFVAHTLEPAFDQLRNAAQTGLLPGVQTALQQLLPLLPALNGFVGGLAETMGNLAQQAAVALTGPFWTQFFNFVSAQAGPILQTLAATFGNIATGLAGLTEAFAPVTSTILGAFDHLSQRFADFATNTAAGSPLEKFVTFVQQSLPVVGQFLENLAKAVGHIATAGASPGLSELRLISDFLGLVNKIPIRILSDILTVLPPLVLALKAWATIQAVLNGVMVVFDAVMAADPIVLIIGAIILAIAALVAGIYELVNNWTTVWAAIQAAAGDAWHFIDSNFVQPIEGFFSSIAGFISQHWQLILGIITGPVGLAVYFITSHFDGIVGFFAGLPAQISAIAVHMWDGITDAFKAAINFIISIWDDLSNLTSFTLPSISLGPFHAGGEHIGPLVPSIPEFRASGGPVKANAPYIVGELGPEVFRPNTAGTIIPNRQLAAPVRSGDTYISVTALNPVDAARQTAHEIGWLQKTRGQ